MEKTMAISLSRGGNASLSKEVQNLKNILVGLGWDAHSTNGGDFDLDAGVFLLKEDGKVRSDNDFIFYNNLRSSDGAVEHIGDNRAGEGDNETIKISLDKIPQGISKIVITLTIHEAATRRQNMGMVSNAFIRIVNQDNNQEIVRFDLSEGMGTEAAVIFGELYCRNSEWKFEAVGQGCNDGIGSLAKGFGVNV